MTIKISHSLRSNKYNSKAYLNNLIAEFVPVYAKQFMWPDKIAGVQICKQDMRGCLSISLFNDNGTISNQRHFLTQSECIAFMQGVIFCVKGY